MDQIATQITQILNSIAKDRDQSTDKLLPAVYEQLRRMAATKLSHEVNGHTLQPTALVHEAYMKLQNGIEDSWENRAHFFGAAAEAMRRVLIDYARARKSQKRGGESVPVSINGIELFSEYRASELIDLDLALEKLQELDPEKAELVKLRFFAGLNMVQAAETLGQSLRTAERNWAYARVWLQREITNPAD